MQAANNWLRAAPEQAVVHEQKIRARSDSALVGTDTNGSQDLFLATPARGRPGAHPTPGHAPARADPGQAS